MLWMIAIYYGIVGDTTFLALCRESDEVQNYFFVWQLLILFMRLLPV